MNSGLVVAKENQKTKIKKLYILEKPYIWCSMKEAIGDPFTDHLKFLENLNSTHSLRVKRGKS